jgi:hypothetical protein
LSFEVPHITRDPERLAALCGLWQRGQREVWLTLQGGSMLPTLPPGSRLRLACGATEPAVGEVVAALQEGRLVIHRLVRIDRDAAGETLYLCRGDANPAADPPVTRAEIVGVVRESRKPPLAHRARVALFRRARRGVSLLLRLARRG